jgi:cytochrome c oxidase assembly protein subunit 15
LAVCATILWGAFTAGLDAGLVYNNTFPKMGAVWIPEEVYTVTSWHEAFIQSHAGVQFIHRWLALMAMILILIWGAHAHIRQYKAWQIPVLAVVILVQVGLGVATLFSGVHLVIATTHQAGAVIVLCLLLGVMHKLHWESSRLQSPKG